MCCDMNDNEHRYYLNAGIEFTLYALISFLVYLLEFFSQYCFLCHLRFL